MYEELLVSQNIKLFIIMKYVLKQRLQFLHVFLCFIILKDLFDNYFKLVRNISIYMLNKPNLSNYCILTGHSIILFTFVQRRSFIALVASRLFMHCFRCIASIVHALTRIFLLSAIYDVKEGNSKRNKRVGEKER